MDLVAFCSADPRGLPPHAGMSATLQSGAGLGGLGGVSLDATAGLATGAWEWPSPVGLSLGILSVFIGQVRVPLTALPALS
jgi:hypothetical protein